jgi:hypothetical protein
VCACHDGEPSRQAGSKEARVARSERALVSREPASRQIAARQRLAIGPGSPRLRKKGSQLTERMLGKLAISGDLAAEDRQQRRVAVRGVELEHVVARDRRWVFRAVVVERAHAAVGPDDVRRGDRTRQIGVGDRAQVVDLVSRNARRVVVDDRDVGRTDQREALLERDDEDDALVGILQDVRVRLGMHARHDDVTALDVPDLRANRVRTDLVEQLLDPGSGGVDHRAREHILALSGAPDQCRTPQAVLAMCGREPRPHANIGAQLARRNCVENDQSRIVDPCVRVDEAFAEAVFEPCTPLAPVEVDAER